MKAIILAAGYGTRLQPLTDHLPKALIPIAGKPLLQIAIERCLQAGIAEIGVNVHHHADQVLDFLHRHNQFGVCIQVSKEPDILGTGGGAKKLIQQMGATEAFLIVNVDVLTDLNFTAFASAFEQTQADALLAVKHRTTQRYLLVDAEGVLCGRGTAEKTVDFLVRPPLGPLDYVAFSGLQMVQPSVLLSYPAMAFSSVDAYLERAKHTRAIKTFIMDDSYWLDVGRPASLQQAQRDVESGDLTL